MKVLLVDKILYHCYHLQKMLLREGCQVIICQTAEDALAHLRKNMTIDLVLTEQDFDVNGIQLYRDTKSLPLYTDMNAPFMPYFAAVTSSMDETLKGNLLANGFLKVMNKPLDASEFAMFIKKVKSGEHFLEKNSCQLNFVVIDQGKQIVEKVTDFSHRTECQLHHARNMKQAKALCRTLPNISAIIANNTFEGSDGPELFLNLKEALGYDLTGFMPPFLLMTETLGINQFKKAIDVGIENILLFDEVNKLERLLTQVYQSAISNPAVVRGNQKILIVDGFRYNYTYLKSRIPEQQFDVIYASTLKDALTLFKEDKNHLIVGLFSELFLKDGDAFMLRKKLKTQCRIKERQLPRMVINTICGDSHLLQMAGKSGFYNVLMKPSDDTQIVACFENIDANTCVEKDILNVPQRIDSKLPTPAKTLVSA